MPSLQSPSWRVPVAVVFSTVAIFGLLVAGLTLRLRAQLRAEVLQREAEAVHAVALMELKASQSLPPGVNEADPMAPLFAAVLESSRLRGVLAVHLFDAEGRLQVAFPDDGSPAVPWWPVDLARPATRFDPDGSLEKVFGVEVPAGSEPTRVPLLEIVVPLRPSGAPAAGGSARYWVDGTSVEAEFKRMDRRLASQAGLAYVGTALLVAAALAWALRRIAQANRRLAAQSADLERANEELDFAAKTSAIGTISAHLIHGLKNPLVGLEGFVSDPAVARGAAPGNAWQSAIETTRRLRALVQEVTTVLRDESDGRAGFALPLRDVAEAVLARVRSPAEAAGVHLESSAMPEATLVARAANLSSLVLANLLHNAIEASVRGGRVTLALAINGEEAEFRVTDTAGGLPDAVRARLFRPLTSTKRNGGGIGLAISRQLARHAGGDVVLVRSDTSGTEFSLRVPLMIRAPAALSPRAGA